MDSPVRSGQVRGFKLSITLGEGEEEEGPRSVALVFPLCPAQLLLDSLFRLELSHLKVPVHFGRAIIHFNL